MKPRIILATFEVHAGLALDFIYPSFSCRIRDAVVEMELCKIDKSYGDHLGDDENGKCNEYIIYKCF